MNEITTLMAQLMGPTFALIGLGMLLNPKFYSKVIKSFSEPDFDQLLTPMIMIPVGIALTMKHFLWGSLPEVLVSIVAIAILVKGIMIAIMPTAFKGILKSLPINGLMWVGGLIWIVGGAYLSWAGFLM